MAATFNFYHNYKLGLGQKLFHQTTDAFILCLLSSSYTPNYATHTTKAHLTNQLSTANGYTQDTKALASKTWALSSGTITWDAADITWTASGGSIGPARYCAIYDDTDASDSLVGLVDFGEDKTAGDGTDFKIVWNASGIFTLA